MKCKAYECAGTLEYIDGRHICTHNSEHYYYKIPELEYKEYKELFKDDLVVAVRKLLEKISNQGDENLEDSEEHNALISYFNKFALHKKVNEETFNTWCNKYSK